MDQFGSGFETLRKTRQCRTDSVMKVTAQATAFLFLRSD
jgi:hypothetical protein